MVSDSREYEVPNVLVAVLSMIGSLAIIINYAFSTRTNWRQLLVFLSICDFVQASFYCFQWIGKGNTEVNVGCIVLSLIGFSSEAASCFWTAAVAHHLHKSINSLLASESRGMNDEEIDVQVYRFYHILAWGYPFIVTLLVAIKHEALIYPCTGIDCFGCFIAPDQVGWRFAAVYFPQWSTWFYVLILYLLTYQHLKKFSQSIGIPRDHRKSVNSRGSTVIGVNDTPRSSCESEIGGDLAEGSIYRSFPRLSVDKSNLLENQLHVEHVNKQLELVKNLRRKLLLVPLVFILLRIPESIFRIREYSIWWNNGPSPEHQEEDWLNIVLNILQAFFNPAQGLFNFILFVLASPKYKFFFTCQWWKTRSDAPVDNLSEQGEDLISPRDKCSQFSYAYLICYTYLCCTIRAGSLTSNGSTSRARETTDESNTRQIQQPLLESE